MQRILSLVLILSSCVFLSGCVGAAIGAGASVGVAAAKEGGLKNAVTDEGIRLTISDLWFRQNTEMFRKLNLTVNQGRVLITGVVQNPQDRVEAVRLAWQATGVKQVINEIRVGRSSSFQSFAQDTWISGELRTRLTFDRDVQSINYSIETVQGTVYLMGVAQDQRELDRAIRIARRVKGVKEVVSYVKLVGEKIPNERGSARGRPSTDPNFVGTGSSASSSTTTTPTTITMPPATDAPSATPAGSTAVEKETLPP